MIQLVYIASVFLFAGALLLGAELLRRRGIHAKYYMRPLALTLSLIAFIAYLWREPAIYNVRGLDMYSPFGDHMATTALAVLIYWFTHAGVLIAVLSVFFEYQTLKMEKRIKNYSGYTAQIIQHEIDHCNGILI